MSNPPDVTLLGKIANYTEILAKDPKSTIFVKLAQTYCQMGLLDDALEVADKGVKAQPRFAPGYTILGWIQAQRKAFEDARAAFRKALDLDGESLSALRGMTRLHLRSGEKGDARQLVQRIVALKPDDQEARNLLDRLGGAPVATTTSKGEAASPAETPEAFKTGSVDKGNPISTPTIAELYVRQGFPKRAMKVYRDLLQADPHNDAIRNKLVELKEQITRDSAVPGEATQPEEKAAPADSVDQSSPTERVTPTSAVEATDNPPAAVRTVETLELWLDSIRKRRDDVR